MKLFREDTYSKLLQKVTARLVVFYDVTDRRAWLVDGASALLHLVRVSLHLDSSNPVFDWVFDDSKLQDSRSTWSGRAAALRILTNLDHRDLPIYIKGRSVEQGQPVLQFLTFGERVENIARLLEFLIDRDTRLVSQDGIKIPQTMDWRKTITGFDLVDLISSSGSISPCAAPLNAWSHGWVDMLPPTGVTTIFGDGFGDLIRPDEPGQICVDWKSVPAGSDHLTAMVSTLKTLYERHLRKPGLGRGEVAKDILWSSPCHPFENCGCLTNSGSGKQRHVDLSQFLISKKSWTASRKLRNTTLVDINTLDEAGAVVFANLALLGQDQARRPVAVSHGTRLVVSSSPAQGSDMWASATSHATQFTGSSAATNTTTATSITDASSTIATPSQTATTAIAVATTLPTMAAPKPATAQPPAATDSANRIIPAALSDSTAIPGLTGIITSNSRTLQVGSVSNSDSGVGRVQESTNGASGVVRSQGRIRRTWHRLLKAIK